MTHDSFDLMKANNISVPRFRGVEHMLNQEPKKVTQELIDRVTFEVMEAVIDSYALFSNYDPKGGCVMYGRTDYYEDRYLDRDNMQVKWHMLERDGRLNRKRRKEIKIHVRNNIKLYQKQFDVHNKYVGRADVLCICARIGGKWNWTEYGGEVVNQPWFIEKVDDAWDNTYCDIYVKIENGHDSASI